MPITVASATSATGPSPGTSSPSRSRPPRSSWTPPAASVPPSRAAHPSPRKVDVYVAKNDERVLQALARLGARHCAAPQRDHPGLGCGEGDASGVLLDRPE